MNRVDFCRLPLQSGMYADPRCRIALSREQQENEAIYDDLKSEKRAVSDLETFSNPHTDSRILPCSPEQNVNTDFAGIDVETPERLLAVRLSEKGTVADSARARLLPYGLKPAFMLVFHGLSGLG